MIDSTRKYSSGSSLVETLIALLVTAIGLLGVLSMQTKAVQLNTGAYHYTQAVILANDMMETLRLYPEVSAAALTTDFDDTAPAETVSACALNNSCSDASETAAWAIGEWKRNIERLLPSGQGAVTYSAAEEIYTIRVQFRVANDGGGDVIYNNPPVTLIARL